MVPAKLHSDECLHALVVEHLALVSQIQEWCDNQALVASSAGQIRRENLWSAVRDWKMMRDELNAKGIVVYGLLDYDKGGDYIAGAHEKWFRDVVDLKLHVWGLTREQLVRLKLPPD